MQGYHFVLFYFQVFVNPVGLVELEGCCEEGEKKRRKKARATCWPENGLVELADIGMVSLYAADNEANHQGLSEEY